MPAERGNERPVGLSAIGVLLSWNGTVSEFITVYTPESSLASPRTMVADMFRDLLKGRSMGWQLAVRDIRAQYRQALLGVLWAFIGPYAVRSSSIDALPRTTANEVSATKPRAPEARTVRALTRRPPLASSTCADWTTWQTRDCRKRRNLDQLQSAAEPLSLIHI